MLGRSPAESARARKVHVYPVCVHARFAPLDAHFCARNNNMRPSSVDRILDLLISGESNLFVIFSHMWACEVFIG